MSPSDFTNHPRNWHSVRTLGSALTFAFLVTISKHSTRSNARERVFVFAPTLRGFHPFWGEGLGGRVIRQLIPLSLQPGSRKGT